MSPLCFAGRVDPDQNTELSIEEARNGNMDSIHTPLLIKQTSRILPIPWSPTLMDQQGGSVVARDPNIALSRSRSLLTLVHCRWRSMWDPGRKVYHIPISTSPKFGLIHDFKPVGLDEPGKVNLIGTLLGCRPSACSQRFPHFLPPRRPGSTRSRSSSIYPPEINLRASFYHSFNGP